MISIFEYEKSQLISIAILELIFFFPLKCKILSRDLASCHAALLLYLVVGSVWEDAGGKGIAGWVRTPFASPSFMTKK